MTVIGGENQVGEQGGSSGGWKYWLGVLRGIFPHTESTDDLRGSAFATAVIDRFKDDYILKDQNIGTWHAALEAAQAIDDATGGEVEARFLISRTQHEVPKNVWAQPVHRPIRATHDFNEGKPASTEDLYLFFSFSDMLPVNQNIKLFEECAIARVKNHQQRTLTSELEPEPQSEAAGAGAD
jgi:hypothetical protein